MTSKQTTSRPDPGVPQPRVKTPCRDQFETLDPPLLVDRYRAGVMLIETRVLEMPDEQLDRWFDPAFGLGRWSCRALLTHLMDSEMLFAMRLRRTITETHPVFENWDEDAFLDSRFSRPGGNSLMMPVGALVASVYTTRQTTATWLVQLVPEDWERRCMTPSLGETTLRQLLAYAAWHLEHHAAFLSAKLAEILGPADDQPVRSGGGCGGGCTCSHQDQQAT